MKTLTAYWKQLALVAVFVLLVCFLLFFGAQSKPYNLIIISLDSVRADRMQMYGYERNTMPNLEAWAKNAFIFENYFATSYLTPISEGSVQTGRYPFSSGIINFSQEAKVTVPFLAELLKQRGYTTATFGSSPEFLVNEALHNSFRRGFDVYHPYPGESCVTETECESQPRTDTSSVSKAIEWLQSGREPERPFYLWIPLGSAHWPYFHNKPIHFADQDYSGTFEGITYDEYHVLYEWVYEDTMYQRLPLGDSTTNAPPVASVRAEDYQYVSDRYDDGLYYSDQIILQILDYLKTSGLDKNTIVVFESEHGESLGERGYIAHYDIYDETVHAPLVIKVPGMEGRRISDLMSGIDILPTVLSVLGIQRASTDGIDFLPVIKKTAQEPRTDVIITRTPLWERVGSRHREFVAEDNTHHFYDTKIRSKKWSLIHRVSRDAQAKYGWWGRLSKKPVRLPEYELYDLEADPNETRTVYDTYSQEPEVSRLRQKLLEYEETIERQKPGPSTGKTQPYF